MIEDERKAVKSQQVRSSGQIRAAQKHAVSVIVGVLSAGLLYMIWMVTDSLGEESRAFAASQTNAFAIMGAAYQQMGAKQSCGIESTDGYERNIETLATFLGFDSAFHWQSPFIVEITVSRQSRSGSASSVSYVIDANLVDVTSRPAAGQTMFFCDKLK